ncbi:MAG: SAM-dependent methyltransferase [Kiritimatiellae bacterium]|nr:SAM-dependent methyltransferase [Kiritimatiellia bacterium]
MFDQETFRPQMHAALGEISALVFDTPDFREASFRFRDLIGPGDNRSLALRPVQIGGEAKWQLSRAGLAENKGRGAAKKELWELANSANILLEAHATAADGAALHMRVTKKGHVLLQRVRGGARPAAAAAAGHDREKDYPLARFDSAALLLALGFTGTDGAMKASMHAKYRQVNEFLRHLDAALDELPPGKDRDRPLSIVDCGCGKAYRSFAAKAYLEATRGIAVELAGVDRKKDVIAACRRTAETLGWSEPGAAFAAGDIAGYKPRRAPDVVLSLHACDTATDDAIAFAVERGARLVLSAPCCQHELQKALPANLRPHRAVLRNGILRERLADILTDAFRAQILRVAGYRASVVEFVDPEATARNVLIRASRVSRPGTGTALADYEDLREAWGVTPYLATRLAPLLPELVPAP